MENFSILFGILFWPAAIIAWFIFLRKRKPARWIGLVGTVWILGMPMLAACSMGTYMFLDEPLTFAVEDGNVGKVKSLLAWGADPNRPISRFHNPALQQAAADGNVEIVRALLAHGADTNAQNGEGFTALASARANGHTAIVRMLQQAGAAR